MNLLVLLFSLNRQVAVADLDFDVFLFEPRQIDSDLVGRLVFNDVDQRE